MSKQQSVTQIYISGNFIDEDGVGHHGELLEVSEFTANKLIKSNNAMSMEDYDVWQQQQAEREEAKKALKAERPAKSFRVISPRKHSKADKEPGSNMV